MLSSELRLAVPNNIESSLAEAVGFGGLQHPDGVYAEDFRPRPGCLRLVALSCPLPILSAKKDLNAGSTSQTPASLHGQRWPFGPLRD